MFVPRLPVIVYLQVDYCVHGCFHCAQCILSKGSSHHLKSEYTVTLLHLFLFDWNEKTSVQVGRSIGDSYATYNYSLVQTL